MTDIDKLISLPVDLFTRHFIAARLVNKGLREDKKSLSILDLGGFAGKTADFFRDDKVTILDIYDSDEPNYVKGDATNLSFADSSFDLVTNFDVFEHIPRSKRAKFISEALRVTRRAAILTLPLDSNEGAAAEAERRMDNFYYKIAGRHHPWLKEHIEYGIPTEKEMEHLLESLGVKFFKVESNRIFDWKLIQALNFLGTVDADSLILARKLNQFYNSNVDSLEAGVKKGYRGIYILIKDIHYLPSMEKVMAANESSNEPIVGIKDQALDMLLDQTAAFLKKSKKQEKHYQASLQAQARELRILDEKVHTLNQELNSVTHSLSWRITSPLRLINMWMKRMAK